MCLNLRAYCSHQDWKGLKSYRRRNEWQRLNQTKYVIMLLTTTWKLPDCLTTWQLPDLMTTQIITWWQIIDIIKNKAKNVQSNWCKIPTECGLISSNFQPTHIWNPWSNKTDANLEDSACTVPSLLFLPITCQWLQKYYSMRLRLPEQLAQLKNTVNNSNIKASWDADKISLRLNYP